MELIITFVCFFFEILIEFEFIRRQPEFFFFVALSLL